MNDSIQAGGRLKKGKARLEKRRAAYDESKPEGGTKRPGSQKK